MSNEKEEVKVEEEKKSEGMIITRLYKWDAEKNKRIYVSRIITRSKKHSGKVKANYTPYRAYAMVFKSTDELMQFQYWLVSGNHGMDAADLLMEKEQISKTFIEEFGEDDMKEGRVAKMNFLAAREFYEGNIARCNAALHELKKIDLNELDAQGKVEVPGIITELEKERDIYTVKLQELFMTELDDVEEKFIEADGDTIKKAGDA